MRSLGWPIIQYDCCPCKKRKFGHRHKGRNVRRHWTANYKPERGDWEGTNPCEHLHLWFLSFKPMRKQISLEATQSVILCYGSPKKQMPSSTASIEELTVSLAYPLKVSCVFLWWFKFFLLSFVSNISMK